MKKPQGYAVLFDPDSDEVIEEFDTFTCGHCNNIVHVKPKCDPTTIGGMCFCCMTFICPQCVETGVCDPFERKLDRMEGSASARRSYKSAGGYG